MDLQLLSGLRRRCTPQEEPSLTDVFANAPEEFSLLLEQKRDSKAAAEMPSFIIFYIVFICHHIGIESKQFIFCQRNVKPKT